MSNQDLNQMDATSLAEAIKAKKVSATEVTKHFLSRIEKHNPKINALLSINKDALARAGEVDQKIVRGEDPGLLAGVPVGVKDLICTRGIETTAASKILKG